MGCVEASRTNFYTANPPHAAGEIDPFASEVKWNEVGDSDLGQSDDASAASTL